LLANLVTRRVARGTATGERGAGLEHERLDLVSGAPDDPRDLLVGEVAELGEDDGGALIVRQPRHVGQDRAQILARRHLHGEVICGRPGHVLERPFASRAQHGQAAMAGDGVEPRAQHDGRFGAHEIAVGSHERLLHRILGIVR
jgi:hypothetical protein